MTSPAPSPTRELLVSSPSRRSSGRPAAEKPSRRPDGRQTVPRSLRFQVLRRDNHACRYCGATAPDARLTVDHVTPVALGGTNDPSNLVTACADCNAGKAATPPDAALVQQVAEDAMRWARARAQAAVLLRQADEERDTKAELVIEHFQAMLVKAGRSPEYGPDDDPYSSVFTRVDRGLEIEDITRLVDQAVRWKVGKIPTNRLWAYLAGCCWNRIRAIEEAASEAVRAEISGDAGAIDRMPVPTIRLADKEPM